MSRIATHLTADHISALFPDVDTPFQDVGDVVNRLLPYHIFQHPREDLLIASKGKRRATETEILQSELAGISFLCMRYRSLAYGLLRNEICIRMLQAPKCT